ncbi:MAG: DUF2760 domain-containing protein [Desulfobacterales bacterium]|nr:DUF2760 domain-containing protein [Desulfobacterales bacterium]
MLFMVIVIGASYLCFMLYFKLGNHFILEHKQIFILWGCGFWIVSMLFWIFLRLLHNKSLPSTDQSLKAKSKSKPQPTHSKEQKTENVLSIRLFLHMLTLLQREGRLIDFFFEDLSGYEDDQIGAAVRSIHGNCKKTLSKYLAPKAVIDKEEGEDVVIHSNFNPDEIKLVGNVAGDPPFTGVLRHKGWRATKVELPTLTDMHDSKIISPAEVELM